MVQIIISIILISIGASYLNDWTTFGFFAGFWFLITGIICVCSGVFFTNKILLGVNLGYTVLTVIGSAVLIMIYSILIDE